MEPPVCFPSRHRPPTTRRSVAAPGLGAAWLVAPLVAALFVTGCNTGGGGGGRLSVRSVSATASSALVSGFAGIPADGASAVTVTVTVRNERGEPLAGYRVSVSASGSFNTIEQPLGVTGPDGVAIAHLRSTRAEPKVLTVRVFDPQGDMIELAQRPGIVFVPVDQVGAATSTISASPPTGTPADGVHAVTVTVTLRDPFANPLGGRDLEITATGLPGTSYTITPATGTAAADGTFSAAVTTTAAGPVTFSATVISGPDAPVTIDARTQAVFDVDPARAAAAVVTLSAQPTDAVVANDADTSLITIDVTDAAGLPVVGVEVELAATGSGNTIEQPPPTDAQGRTQGRLRSSIAETKTVSATIDPNGVALLAPARVEITFIGDAAALSPTRSALVLNPSSGVIADGAFAVSVTATVRDGNGNPVPDVEIALQPGTATATISPASGRTDLEGRFEAQLGATAPGAVSVSATLDPNGSALVIDAHPSAVFEPAPASATASSVVVDRSAGVLADGNDFARVTVTLRDRNGNPLPDRDVALTVSPTGAILTPASGRTGPDGALSVTLSATLAETVTIHAVGEPGTAREVTLADKPIVQFDEPLPEITSIRVPSAPLEGCVPITYRVRDARAARVEVTIEVRLDPSSNFVRATQAGSSPGQDGVQGVTSSADIQGAEHVFLWDATRDFPHARSSDVEVRLTPSRSGFTGPARTEGGIAIDHTIRFDSPIAIGSGALNPNGIALGDLDGDGLEDMVLANQVFSVTVLLQDPASPGDFLPPVALAAGASPIAVALGDLDRDGRLDIAIANRNDTAISVLYGDPSGQPGQVAFEPATAIAVGAAPIAVAIADLNRDGAPDLAAINHDDDTLTVRFQDALNPRSFPASLRADVDLDETPGQNDPQALVVADLDRDGAPDLAVGHSSPGKISVLINTSSPGASTLSATITELSEPGLEDVSALAAADLNADGQPDLLAAFAQSDALGLFVQSNLGGTNFFFDRTLPLAQGAGPRGLAVIDLDRDGALDIAVAELASGALSVLAGDRDQPGAFASPRSFAALPGLWAVAAADLDRDGAPDLFVTNQNTDEVSLFRNTTARPCTARFDAPQALSSGNGIDPLPEAITRGDVNGDGKLDLVAANRNDDTFSVLLGDGAGGFAPARDVACGTEPIDIEAADFDQDGRLDVAVLSAAGPTLSVFRNLSPEGATTTAFAPPEDLSVAGAGALTAADLNGDTRPDLAVSAPSSGSIEVRLNETPSGAQTLLFSAAQAITTGAAPETLIASDLDGDDLADLAFTDLLNDQIGVVLNRTQPAAATFSAATPELYPSLASPQALAAGDLNGDLLPELVVGYAATSGNDVVSVFVNTSARLPAPPSFAPAFHRNVGAEAEALAVLEVDGDGRADIVAAQGVAGELVVLRNQTLNGATQPDFAAPESSPIPTSVHALTTLDADADGRLDLALTATAADTHPLEARLNRSEPGRSAWAEGIRFATGAGAQAIALGDLDHDGRLDVVSADQSAGTLSVLRNASTASTPSFDAALAVDLGSSAEPSALALADVHGRGRLDLVAIDTASNELVIVRNDTASAGALAFATPSRYSLGAGAQAFTTGDFDLDGRIDFVSADTGAGALTGYRNDTPSGATTTSLIAFSLPSLTAAPVDVASADFDRDGRLDLAVLAADRTWVLRNESAPGDPSPTFAAALEVATVGGDRLAAADIDRDGAVDLAILDSVAAEIHVLRNRSARGQNPVVFNTEAPLAAGKGASALGVLDLDANGRLELVLARAGADAATRIELLGEDPSGGFSWAAPVSYATPRPAPLALGAADIDRDGRLDLVLVHADGSVTLLRGR